MLRCLMYHDITARDSDVRHGGQVSIDVFRSHLTTLGPTIRARDIVTQGSGKCAITFDDGYAGWWMALEALCTDSINKATFFPTVVWARREGRGFLQEAHRLGMEIGNHTWSHPNLQNIQSDADLEREVRESQIVLEDLVGAPIVGFAYPYGAYNRHSRQLVVNYYRYAVSVRAVNMGFDRFALPRVRAMQTDTSGWVRFKSYLTAANFK